MDEGCDFAGTTIQYGRPRPLVEISDKPYLPKRCVTKARCSVCIRDFLDREVATLRSGHTTDLKDGIFPIRFSVLEIWEILQSPAGKDLAGSYVLRLKNEHGEIFTVRDVYPLREVSLLRKRTRRGLYPPPINLYWGDNFAIFDN